MKHPKKPNLVSMLTVQTHVPVQPRIDRPTRGSRQPGDGSSCGLIRAILILGLAGWWGGVACGGPVVATTTLPNRQVNLPYTNVTLAAAGGVPAYTWAVTAGQLPDGLALDANAGSLTGTPTNPGQFDFTMSVRDSTAQTASQALSITIHPAPSGYPLATEMTDEQVTGLARGDTNFLAVVRVAAFDGQLQPFVTRLISNDGSPVGPPASLGRPSNRALAAFDGTNYLVVWEDAETDHIYGQLLSQSNTSIGTGFPIASATGKQSFDSMRAISFDGSNYLVIWRDERNTTNAECYGQFVSPLGLLVGGEIALSTQPGDLRSPALVFDGTEYLAVWLNQQPWEQPGYDVWGRFISKSGALSDLVQINQSSTPVGQHSSLRVAFSGQHYLVVWSAWQGGAGPQATGWDVMGRMVNSNRTLVGEEFPVSTASGNQLMPAISEAGTDFLVYWLSMTNGSPRGIRGQIISAAGERTGLDFLIFGSEGGRLPIGPVFLFQQRWMALPSYSTVNGGGRVPDGDCFSRVLNLPPWLSPLGFSPACHFQLRVSANPGQAYEIQASSTLKTWTKLFTTNAPDREFLVEDAEAARAPQRFYRVMALQ